MQPEQRVHTNKMKCIVAPGNDQLVDFGNLLPTCRTGTAGLTGMPGTGVRISAHPKVNMYKQHDRTARAIKYAEPEVILSHGNFQGR